MYYTSATKDNTLLKRIFRRKNRAFIPLIILAAAAAFIFIPRLQRTGTRTIIKDSFSVTETSSIYTEANDIISEQRKSLHPFDMISYAGFNEDGSFIMEIRRAPHITVIDGGSVSRMRSVIGETVGSLLSREGFDISLYDSVVPPVETILDADTDITIERAVPVTIDADSSRISVLAAGMTVGELLGREGIDISEHDILNHTLSEPVSSNMNIIIHRVEYKEKYTVREIPFSSVIKDSPHLPIGTTEVVSEGKNGSETVTTLHKYIDGDEVSSEYVSSKAVAPTDRVILRGTAFAEPISKREGDYSLKDGIPASYEYVLSGKVTAYTAPAGAGTYSGRPLIVGSVGVDPDVIPFGSELYIVSQDRTHVYGYAVASDTGDLSQAGVLVDVFMGLTADHYSDACAWGAQFCDVYVIRTGDNSVSWQ